MIFLSGINVNATQLISIHAQQYCRLQNLLRPNIGSEKNPSLVETAKEAFSGKSLFIMHTKPCKRHV
jgi:hypothetical protein